MKTEVIYDMPHEEYLAHPALSSSAIKTINVSISDYMEAGIKETKALTLGTAIHDAILYGLDSFLDHYTTPYVKEDGVLDTVEDLKAFCNENNIDAKSKWKKDDYINAIKDSDCEAFFYADELQKHKGDKTILSEDNFNRVLKIHEHLSNSNIWRDIQAMKKEVSVFWTDKDGIRCKCRFDGVNGDMFDLKSFDNYMGKSVEQCVIKELTKWQYDISCVFYAEGYQYARKAGFEGFNKADPAFHFLFVQTEGGYNYVPITLRQTASYIQPDGTVYNQYWCHAENKIKEAKALYKAHVMEKQPIRYNFRFAELEDRHLPAYHFTEGKI